MTFLYADAATDGFGLARNRKSEVDPWCISMNRQRALDLLRRSKPELQAQFGVTRLALLDRPPAMQHRPTVMSMFWSPLMVLQPPGVTSACSSILRTCSGAQSTWLPRKLCVRSYVLTSNGSGSLSDTSLREWRFYLDDMLDFAGRVLTYTEG